MELSGDELTNLKDIISRLHRIDTTSRLERCQKNSYEYYKETMEEIPSSRPTNPAKPKLIQNQVSTTRATQ